MLLDKHSLTTDIADNATNGRYALESLCLLPNGAVLSTCGKTLLYVPPVPDMDAKDAPKIDGVQASWAPTAPTLLDADDAKALAKAIPKKAPLPIVQTAQVAAGVAGVTNLSAVQNFRLRDMADRPYPDRDSFKQVVEAALPDEPTAHGQFDLDLLIDVLTALKKATRLHVKHAVLRLHTTAEGHVNLSATTKDGAAVLLMGLDASAELNKVDTLKAAL